MAILAASGGVAEAVDDWSRDSAISEAALAAPLGRLGTAVAPLLRHQEPGLAETAEGVLTAAVEHHGDDDRTERALTAFHTALRAALAPPAPARPWWALRRRRRALSE